MFIDRQRELAFLDGLLSRAKTGSAQLCTVTGRRRTGKTELLLHWANRIGVPYVYWAAVKETPWQQRMRLSARLFDEPLASAPVFQTWADLWEAAARDLARNHRILILDNFPYVADADAGMVTALLSVWEKTFQGSDMVVILCGAQQRSMQELLTEKSPLHGRVTAQLHVDPLPFAALQPFFPGWDVESRVGAFAISGGVPAYLAWLNPALDLTANVQQVMLQPGSMFLSEPAYLLYDELREHNNYLGILKAIGTEAHSLTAISERTSIPVTSTTFYLGVLQELRLVERRLSLLAGPPEPVRTRATAERGTVPRGAAARGGHPRSGRYYLNDPFFHFYMRFIEPYLADCPYRVEQVMEGYRVGLQNFIAENTFPELALRWLARQAEKGNTPFSPEVTGHFWNDRIDMPVVAVNWGTRDILLGDCKWRADPVDLLEVRALIETKTRWVLQDLPAGGEGWRVHYAFFSRKGFLPPAYAQIQRVGGLAVNINTLDTGLSQ